MFEQDDTLERITVRVPKSWLPKLDAIAPEGERAKWIRLLIENAMDPEGPSGNSIEEQLGDLRKLLKRTHHRVRMVEARMYHENHALFHYMTCILDEAVHARVASFAAATSTGFYDEEGVPDAYEALLMEAGSTFKRLDDSVTEQLKNLRDEAVVEARGLPDTSDDAIAGIGG